MKPKKCALCKTPFIPNRPMQKCCSPDCAYDYAKGNRLKAERIADRESRKVIKLKLKTRSDWMREAQTAVNRYIRLRDSAEPCISCGRHHEGQYHAGHYLSTGARPDLRFDESNVHRQCQPCNVHLSGNLVNYRKALIQKIGLAEVERLEGPAEPKKYTVDDLIEIKSTYTKKAKEIANG